MEFTIGGIKRTFFVVVVALLSIAVLWTGTTNAQDSPPGPECHTPTPIPEPESGNITVLKFHDRNGDGVQQGNEENLEGWLFRLYRWKDGELVLVAEDTTDDSGKVVFEDLKPALYKVWEELPEHWAPTTPEDGGYWDGGYYVKVTVEEGESLDLEFGNVYTSPPPTACIDLEKTGPETASSGDTITYHYRVHNCGELPFADGVVVYDPLISPDPIYSGILAPDGVAEFDVLYTLPLDHCGEWDNHAWAIGYPDGYPEVRDDDEWTVRVPCEAATLILEPDGATNILPLDASHLFTATVLNQLGAPIEGITVSFSTDFGQFEGDGQYVERNTDAAGQAAVTITSTLPGVAHIRAWIDEGDAVYSEGEVTDLPSVKVWKEKEENPNLEVTKSAAAVWEVNYDWYIGKSPLPDNLFLRRGESGEILYSIEVGRALATGIYSYTVQGIISAHNTGDGAANLVDVVDCIEYHDPVRPGPEPDGFTTLSCQTIQVGGTIAAGDTAQWAYAAEFLPRSGADGYRNRVEVTISNHPQGEYTYLYRVPLPATPTHQEDACAVVTDQAYEVDGFAVSSDYPAGGWSTCESTTFLVHTTVTNTDADPGAGPGGYSLINTAFLVEQDSGRTSRADTTVILRTPDREPATLILAPEAATNVLPEQITHVFTATVLDQNGDPMEGIPVSFETDFGYFEGPIVPTGHDIRLAQHEPDQYIIVLSDQQGRASVTIGSTLTGVAHIRAWIDQNQDEYFTVGEVTDTPSTKTWMGATPIVMSVVPHRETLVKGQRITYHTVIEDAAGAVVDVTAITAFRIDDAAAGSWVGNVYTTGNLGTWTVRARCYGQNAEAILEVVPQLDFPYTVFLPVYHASDQNPFGPKSGSVGGAAGSR